MNSSEIRSSFLKFFKDKNHKVLESAPLTTNDPTLLFINAGMAPLKEYFIKRDESMPRATSAQKCLRTIDLEMVGHTSRHHTFFEMLGNFSFGDYFKKEACAWAWEYLTKTLNISEELLWITIYKGDTEALDAWKSLGVKTDRIKELKENFWTMGDTGPCGPCSEIIIDRGKEKGCGKKTCSITCDCDRHLELWNLVFTQFDLKKDGSLIPLKQQNIDTGMGLERLVSVMQGKDSGFETDLFKPIIDNIIGKYDVSVEKELSNLRIVADHVRSATFLISEGVHPSNEGKGYVLRRIIRRAIRNGKKWDKKPFIYLLSPLVVEIMKDAYPELSAKREYISKVIFDEENNFELTLNQGARIFDELIEELKHANKNKISGAEAFKLYDTYGLPFDFIKEMGDEAGFGVDEEGYIKEMETQRTRSRSSRSKVNFMNLTKGYATVGQIFDSSWEMLENETEIAKIFRDDGKEIESLKTGEKGTVVLHFTPFYYESGGQVGDTGKIYNENTEVEVFNTPAQYFQEVRVKKGEIKIGDKVTAEVDYFNRSFTTRHHTATHLLQAALRQVLGSHVEQRGSMVCPDYLRFDFTHLPPMDKEQLGRVEEIVNRKIAEGFEVKIDFLTLAEAKKTGAMAIFGEKYKEDRVRVVSVLDLCNNTEACFSRELCGGTHVKNTMEIGLFKITSHEGVAKGIRRIEAVCSWPAYTLVKNQFQVISEVSDLLKLPSAEFVKGVSNLIAGRELMEQELKKLRKQSVKSLVPGLLGSKEEIKGISIISGQIDSIDPDILESIYDSIDKQLKSYVSLFTGIVNDRAAVFGKATQDLKDKINLGQIMKEIAPEINGGGGGSNIKAQAQGVNISGISNAVEKAKQLIKKQLNG